MAVLTFTYRVVIALLVVYRRLPRGAIAYCMGTVTEIVIKRRQERGGRMREGERGGGGGGGGEGEGEERDMSFIWKIKSLGPSMDI